MFLSIILLSISVFVLSGCDNPVQNKNNTTAGSLKAVPHPSPEEFGNYLSGTWVYKGQLFIYDNAKKTLKNGNTPALPAKLFQWGNVEIISQLDPPKYNSGPSYTVTRKGPRNMTLSIIANRSVPPNTLKLYKPQGIESFDLVKVK